MVFVGVVRAMPWMISQQQKKILKEKKWCSTAADYYFQKHL